MIKNTFTCLFITLFCASTYPLYAATQQPDPLAHSSKDPWMQRVLHSHAHCLNIAPIMAAIYAYMQPATKGSVFVVDAHGKETEQPIATVQTAWDRWEIRQASIERFIQSSLQTQRPVLKYQACDLFGKPLDPAVIALACPTTTLTSVSLTLSHVQDVHDKWVLWTPRIEDFESPSRHIPQLKWTDSTEALSKMQVVPWFLEEMYPKNNEQEKRLTFFTVPLSDQSHEFSSHSAGDELTERSCAFL